MQLVMINKRIYFIYTIAQLIDCINIFPKSVWHYHK